MYFILGRNKNTGTVFACLPPLGGAAGSVQTFEEGEKALHAAKELASKNKNAEYFVCSPSYKVYVTPPPIPPVVVERLL